MSDAGWCYSDGRDGWYSANSREDAIAKGFREGNEGRGGLPVARIGRQRRYGHAELVGGLGDVVLDSLRERAGDEVGDAAEDYPELRSNEAFCDALEEWVLAWLKDHAEPPNFFVVIDEEIVPLGGK